MNWTYIIERWKLIPDWLVQYSKDEEALNVYHDLRAGGHPTRPSYRPSRRDFLKALAKVRKEQLPEGPLPPPSPPDQPCPKYYSIVHLKDGKKRIFGPFLTKGQATGARSAAAHKAIRRGTAAQVEHEWREHNRRLRSQGK